MATKLELINRIHKEYIITKHLSFKNKYTELQRIFKSLTLCPCTGTQDTEIGYLLSKSSLPIKVSPHDYPHDYKGSIISLMTVPEIKKYKDSKGYTKALEKKNTFVTSLRGVANGS